VLKVRGADPFADTLTSCSWLPDPPVKLEDDEGRGSEDDVGRGSEDDEGSERRESR